MEEGGVAQVMEDVIGDDVVRVTKRYGRSQYYISRETLWKKAVVYKLREIA